MRRVFFVRPDCFFLPLANFIFLLLRCCELGRKHISSLLHIATSYSALHTSTCFSMLRHTSLFALLSCQPSRIARFTVASNTPAAFALPFIGSRNLANSRKQYSTGSTGAGVSGTSKAPATKNVQGNFKVCSGPLCVCVSVCVLTKEPFF